MLRNVKHLHRLVQAAHLGLLVDDEVDVHVGVYKVSIRGSAHRALDAHEAVLLGPAEHGPGVQNAPVLVPCIGPDPTDVLASPESPILEAESAQVQAITASAPEEHEAPTRTDLSCIRKLSQIIEKEKSSMTHQYPEPLSYPSPRT